MQQIIGIGGNAVVDPEASNALAECLARISQLEEENTHLRQAAKTFGDLAERLKHALDIELGRAADTLSEAGAPLSDAIGRTALAEPAADMAAGGRPAVRLVK